MAKKKRAAVKADKYPALGGDVLGLTAQGPGDPMTQLYSNERNLNA